MVQNSPAYFMIGGYLCHAFHLFSLILLFPILHFPHLLSCLLRLPHTQTYFSYNPKEDKVIPCKEAGLEFQKGDILHIVDMEDRNWWQAKKEGDPTNRAGKTHHHW